MSGRKKKFVQHRAFFFHVSPWDWKYHPVSDEKSQLYRGDFHKLLRMVYITNSDEPALVGAILEGNMNLHLVLSSFINPQEVK